MSWVICREDLGWWSEESHLVVGLPLGLAHPQLSLFTDASDTGWRGLSFSSSFIVSVPGGGLRLPSGCFPSAISSCSSSFLVFLFFRLVWVLFSCLLGLLLVLSLLLPSFSSFRVSLRIVILLHRVLSCLRSLLPLLL